ncbi:MAG: efflux RND transporter periplasmic adaptor subunit [Rhodobacteraceae bacterium]|nr:efflux RND transporter periplasmic adaptor subunit [Paracoccaceae bacterium]
MSTQPASPTRRRLASLLITAATLAGAGIAVTQGAALISARAAATDLAIAASPTPVAVQRLVEVPGFVTQRAFLGQVEPAQTAELSFELSGKLSRIVADEGQAVRRGDLLARLDTQLLEAEQRRLEAARDAQAAELRFAEAALSRRTALNERGFAPAESSDQARATRDALIARMAETDAGLEAVRLRIEKSELHAPFDGWIGARLQDTGAALAAGQPLFRLLQNDRAVIRVGLPVWIAPEDLLHRDDLTVTLGGQTLAARVHAIRPDVDPATRTRTVLLHVDTAAGAAFGQTAVLHLPRPIDVAGAWVPLGALREGTQGVWTVFVVDPESRVRPAAVEILHSEADRAFVRGSFQDGALLISDGPHRVTPGQTVRVIEGI